MDSPPFSVTVPLWLIVPSLSPVYAYSPLALNEILNVNSVSLGSAPLGNTTSLVIVTLPVWSEFVTLKPVEAFPLISVVYLSTVSSLTVHVIASAFSVCVGSLSHVNVQSLSSLSVAASPYSTSFASRCTVTLSGLS